MSTDPRKNPKIKEDLDKLLSDLKGDSSEGDFASIIKHMRMAGGPRKGIKSFFEEKNKKSIAKTGFKSTVKTAASWVFSESVSDVLSAMFDKKVGKPEIPKDKPDDKDHGKGNVTKKDLGKIKGEIIKNVVNKINKESKRIGDEITEAYSHLDDSIKETNESISEAYANLDASIDDGVKEIKDDITEAYSNLNDSVTAVRKDLADGLDAIDKSFKDGIERVTKATSSAFGKLTDQINPIIDSVFALTKTVETIATDTKSIIKAADKILESIDGCCNDDEIKETATKKTSTSLALTDKSAKDLGGIILKPEAADAEFLSPEFTFLEADEQERIAQDALKDALDKIIKENPDLFKQNDSMFGSMIEAALGAALLKKFGGIFKGMGAGAKGIGGALKGTFSKGAATATEAATTGGVKALEKEAAETAVKKGGTKALGKVAGKTVLKSVLKKLPIIGAIAGLGFAAARAAKGDFTGAAMEAASGIASTLPGAGTAASVGIDAALAARDSGLVPGMGPPPEKAAEDVAKAAEAKKAEVVKKGTEQTEQTSATMVAGLPVIPGQPLNDTQVKAVEMSMRMGNTPKPEVQKAYDLAKKQTAAQPATPAPAPAPTTAPETKPTPTATPAAASSPPPPAPKSASTPANAAAGDDWSTGTAGQKMNAETKNAILKMNDADAKQAIAAWHVLTDPNAGATAQVGAGELFGKLLNKSKAELKPAAQNPAGQQIIDGNRNIQASTAAANAPAAAPTPPAPNQVNITSNSIVPSDKSASKIDLNPSDSTMNRLSKHDADFPGMHFNF